MLGMSITAFGIPSFLGYAIHARRKAVDRVPATIALIVAVLEAVGIAFLLSVSAYHSVL